MPDLNLLLSLLTKFAWLGNWLFFILAFIESAPFIGLVIPGATLIFVGGFLAAQDYLNTWDIIIFASIGAICGDFFSYSLGRWGGNFIKEKKIVNQTILKHGEEFFQRYGNKSIFFGRFFGPLRAIIPFIAGLSRMKRKPFIFWNVLSGIGWAMLNVFLGHFSGTLVSSIFKKWSGRLSLILIILLVAAVTYFILKKKGESIMAYFKTSSLSFSKKLHSYQSFQKLQKRYPVIEDFFKESKRAEEKLFGSVLAFSFLLFTYLLIIILDVF
jgi:undecaprenyl-diphosphatase